MSDEDLYSTTYNTTNVEPSRKGGPVNWGSVFTMLLVVAAMYGTAILLFPR